MPEAARTALIDRRPFRDRLVRLADGLAIAVAVTLPWSVTASGIAIALWLIVVLPITDWSLLRRSLVLPAVALPLLLVLIAGAGVAWSEAPPLDQFGSFKIFARLAIIALLIAHFQQTERGYWVVGGFVASCSLLLAVSWYFWMFIPPGAKSAGVPVKDYIVQSSEFLICLFALSHLSMDAWRRGERRQAWVLGLLAVVFLANISYVASARSALVALVVLALLFVFQRFGWRKALGMVAFAAIAGSLLWMSSSYLRMRVLDVAQEVHDYQALGAETSSGYRLEFWSRSIVIISQAPIMGHGTGSQREQFRRTASAGEGIGAVITDNPHNQVLYSAIQFGGFGTILLFAMWFAHLMLFRGDGLVAWVGTAVVTQNVIAGLFNTSLVEFTAGWIYIFGIGVLGGMMLRADRTSMVEQTGERGGVASGP
jgi:O-antigen ligase